MLSNPSNSYDNCILIISLTSFSPLFSEMDCNPQAAPSPTRAAPPQARAAPAPARAAPPQTSAVAAAPAAAPQSGGLVI